MSLCFHAAFLAKRSGAISQREYLRGFIAHFRGIRHVEDDADNAREASRVKDTDLLGGSFRDVALRTSYTVVHDTTSYENLFDASLEGNLIQVKNYLDQLGEGSPNPIQPLAVLAASERHAAILQLCLERGATFDYYLDASAWNGAETPAMLDVLFAANWRNVQQDPTVLENLLTKSFYRDVGMLNWLLNHGVHVDVHKIRWVATSPVSAQVMKVLVSKCGYDPLKYPGTLQLAAGRGEAELVRYLLSIGVDANEVPPNLDVREPGPDMALHEAIQGGHTEVVRILLDAGADINALTCMPVPRGLPEPSALQLARQLGDSAVLQLVEAKQHKSADPGHKM